MALFAGLMRAHGIYEVPRVAVPGVKRAGSARTVSEPVTLDLWVRHLRGEIQIGIVPIRDDGTCLFGSIDIDKYDLDHAELWNKVRTLKLPLVLCRTKSGGAHLHVFFRAPQTAEQVRELLAHWAAMLGYARVEIFPKQSALASEADTGNWINMPYCGGDKSDRYAIVDNNKLSLEQFLDMVEAGKAGEGAFTITMQEDAKLEEAPPCLIALSKSGVGSGGRNNALFAFGCYAKRRWPEEWKERLAELNEKYFNPPLEEAEVTEIAEHLEKKAYNYNCKQPPIADHCQKSLCMKRKYGIDAAGHTQTFGLDFESLVWLPTEPSQWFANYMEARIRIDAKMWSSPSLMRTSIIDQVGRTFPDISMRAWHNWAAATLASAQKIVVPKETKKSNQVIFFLEEYCIERWPAKRWDDILAGGAMEHEGRHYFLHTKFLNEVSRVHRLRFSASEAWTALLSRDVKSESRKIAKKQVVLWSVTAFDKPQTEEVTEGAV